MGRRRAQTRSAPSTRPPPPPPHTITYARISHAEGARMLSIAVIGAGRIG
ncbi:hypothetical protein HMPREF1129_0232, partial [Actinomyces naeslundii str. Howell 279]